MGLEMHESRKVEGCDKLHLWGWHPHYILSYEALKFVDFWKGWVTLNRYSSYTKYATDTSLLPSQREGIGDSNHVHFRGDTPLTSEDMSQ